MAVANYALGSMFGSVESALAHLMPCERRSRRRWNVKGSIFSIAQLGTRMSFQIVRVLMHATRCGSLLGWSLRRGE